MALSEYCTTWRCWLPIGRRQLTSHLIKYVILEYKVVAGSRGAILRIAPPLSERQPWPTGSGFWQSRSNDFSSKLSAYFDDVSVLPAVTVLVPVPPCSPAVGLSAAMGRRDIPGTSRHHPGRPRRAAPAAGSLGWGTGHPGLLREHQISEIVEFDTESSHVSCFLFCFMFIVYHACICPFTYACSFIFDLVRYTIFFMQW